jgi:hypothetical protein
VRQGYEDGVLTEEAVRASQKAVAARDADASESEDDDDRVVMSVLDHVNQMRQDSSAQVSKRA